MALTISEQNRLTALQSKGYSHCSPREKREWTKLSNKKPFAEGIPTRQAIQGVMKRFGSATKMSRISGWSANLDAWSVTECYDHIRVDYYWRSTAKVEDAVILAALLEAFPGRVTQTGTHEWQVR